MRRWFAALLLVVSVAPAAFAGGVHGKVEGPNAAGVYTLRTYACEPGQTFEPWGMAEGLFDNKTRTVLLHLRATKDNGVFEFDREWPKEGFWMLRLNLGAPPAPATVAKLRPDGSVLENKLYYKSDGSDACKRAFRAMGWKPAPGDDC